jgi:Recombination endonuclease VII
MKMKKLRPILTCTRPDLTPSSAYKYAKCRCERCLFWKYDAAKRTNSKERAAERSREWRKHNLERSRENSKRYQREHPEKVLAYQLKKYGLSLDQYNSFAVKQKGVCAICRQKPRGLSHGKRRLSVDHDAKTGYVRGLLCGACNVGIGHLGHSKKILSSAISYLIRTQIQTNGDVY